MVKQFYKKPRKVQLRCSSCAYAWSIEVANIYNDEIGEISNCPHCGSNKVEVLKVKKV